GRAMRTGMNHGAIERNAVDADVEKGADAAANDEGGDVENDRVDEGRIHGTGSENTTQPLAVTHGLIRGKSELALLVCDGSGEGLAHDVEGRFTSGPEGKCLGA